MEANPNQTSVFLFVRSVTAKGEGEGDPNSDTTARHSWQEADTS